MEGTDWIVEASSMFPFDLISAHGHKLLAGRITVVIDSSNPLHVRIARSEARGDYYVGRGGAAALRPCSRSRGAAICSSHLQDGYISEVRRLHKKRTPAK